MLTVPPLAEPILTRLYDKTVPCYLQENNTRVHACRTFFFLTLSLSIFPRPGLVMDRKQDCSLKTPYICMLPGRLPLTRSDGENSTFQL